MKTSKAKISIIASLSFLGLAACNQGPVKSQASSFIDTIESQDYTFTLYEGYAGYFVSDYKGNEDRIKIPGVIKGKDKEYKVIGIDSYAFYQRSPSTIELDPNITTIRKEAFAGSKVNNLYATSSLVKLEEGAFDHSSIKTYQFGGFNYLPSLDSSYCVVIGNYPIEGYNLHDETLSIADRALDGLTGDINYVKGILSIGDQEKTILNIKTKESVNGEVKLNYVGSHALKASEGVILDRLDLSNCWGDIGNEAFYLKTNELLLGEKITTIGDRAFYDIDCQEVNIPSSVTSLGKYAFANGDFDKLVVPDTVVTFEEGSLLGCKIEEASICPGARLGLSLPHGVYDYDETSIKKLIIEGKGDYLGYLYINNNTLEEVEIKSKIKSFDHGSFYMSPNLVSVKLPSSLKTIGARSFEYCPKLSYVEVGEGLEEIGEEAFGYDESFTGFVASWPASLKAVGKNAFKGTKIKDYPTSTIGEKIEDYAFRGYEFEEFVIPEGATSLGAYSFAGCLSLTEITLPSTLKSIGNYAFSNCPNLKKINLPEGLTTIGDYAFKGCSSLQIEALPKSLYKLGAGAYEGCLKISKLTLPTSIKEVGDYALPDSVVSLTLDASMLDKKIARNVKEFIVSGGNKIANLALENYQSVEKVELHLEGKDLSLGNSSFSGCTNLKEISIPEGIKTIPSSCFEGCSELTELTIPSSVTSLGINTFKGCSKLNPTFLGELTAIPSHAFDGCHSLTSVPLGQGLTRIDEYAFNGCYSLNCIKLPSTLTNIYDYAFNRCYNLVEIENHSKLNLALGSSKLGEIARYALGVISAPEESKLSIDDNGFVIYNENTLCGYRGETKELTIPSGLSTYLDHALINRELDKMTAPCNISSLMGAKVNNLILTSGPNLTKIGDNAFKEATFQSVTIAEGVKEIGSGAFSNNASLTNVELPSSITRIGASAFYCCKGLASFTLPSGVNSIYGNTFSQTSIEDLYIPYSVNFIDKYGLSYLSNGATLHYDGSKAEWDKIKKDSDWKSGSNFKYTLVCLDGEFAV